MEEPITNKVYWLSFTRYKTEGDGFIPYKKLKKLGRTRLEIITEATRKCLYKEWEEEFISCNIVLNYGLHHISDDDQKRISFIEKRLNCINLNSDILCPKEEI